LEIRPLDPRSTFERSKFILKMSEPWKRYCNKIGYLLTMTGDNAMSFVIDIAVYLRRVYAC
jgi:hypothetical protein